MKVIEKVTVVTQQRVQSFRVGDMLNGDQDEIASISAKSNEIRCYDAADEILVSISKNAPVVIEYATPCSEGNGD